MLNRTAIRQRIGKVGLFAALILPVANGICASAIYPAVVTGDGPLAYYRFNDSQARGNINVNSGSIGAAGNAVNTSNLHSFPGAIAGSGDRSQFFDTGTSYGNIPYTAAMNPDNTKPFTVEAWFYAASDQINGGQCPINNRHSSGVTDRTGWVFFQRAPDDSYSRLGPEGIGWDFRMYRGAGSSSGLDTPSGVPFQVGTWSHVVVVYDPIDPITNASLTIYINGVAATNIVWTGGATGDQPGYVSNPEGSDVDMSFGAYNIASGAGGNPFFGGIDEFAFYTNKLTEAQILAHYQNATNANRSTPYDVLIKSANPVVYLRFNEPAPGADLAVNMGDSRNAGDATYTSAIKHPGPSALAGRTDDGSLSGHRRNIGTTGHAYASIPWNAQNNPDSSVPFTFEGWFQPLNDEQNPGPSPVNNRLANGVADRTGWVIYQRSPNDTYESPGVPGHSGVGWTFRMYTGQGGSGNDVLTGVPYNIGDWTHLVVTWEPQTDMGLTSSGSEQWQGILTAYVNGAAVATNGDITTPGTGAVYAANVSPTADGRDPADLAIGSYNLASGLGEEFEGNIDEIALYTNYVLTADQILAHYMTGTNSHPATNYETLVLTAAYDGTTTQQRSGPPTYLRFNEAAYFPAANSGSLDGMADGALVMGTNNAQGPTSAGFEASNSSVYVTGTNDWVSLNNPAGLNISGQISLEAWINPDANQPGTARIISHGPPTPSNFDSSLVETNGSLLGSNEVFLRIESDGSNYAVGSSDGTTTHGASYMVPAADLGGGQWIHLVGTYDGANWKLYRNGVQVASVADAVGALPVDGAEWAIGSTGNGWGDYFAGAIDEVAIYNVALTPAQVQTHYYVGHNGGDVSLSFTRSGGNVSIIWPAGTLQQADAVTGPYTNVSGATSPYTVPVGTTKKFYRAKL